MEFALRENAVLDRVTQARRRRVGAGSKPLVIPVQHPPKTLTSEILGVEIYPTSTTGIRGRVEKEVQLTGGGFPGAIRAPEPLESEGGHLARLTGQCHPDLVDTGVAGYSNGRPRLGEGFDVGKSRPKNNLYRIIEWSFFHLGDLLRNPGREAPVPDPLPVGGRKKELDGAPTNARRAAF